MYEYNTGTHVYTLGILSASYPLGLFSQLVSGQNVMGTASASILAARFVSWDPQSRGRAGWVHCAHVVLTRIVLARGSARFSAPRLPGVAPFLLSILSPLVVNTARHIGFVPGSWESSPNTIAARLSGMWASSKLLKVVSSCCSTAGGKGETVTEK
ncbi:hypothetical protein B0T24DRAFT_50580 [Lasiosphaeria ovina]|uniref:Uncharacterized protein n=1 Tax=Lasiosphaeria ovina TaxID=92902 RepID=A0AAE0NL37_9PEZI|nr:hypothetical protein B0T24DRAFT_50580 [Lasiosphaeria ovina]